MSVSRRSLLKTGGVAAIVSCSCGLTACVSTNAATGRSSFTGGFSPADDIQLGSEQHPKMLAAFGGEYEHKKLQRYVNTLGRKLAQFTEYQQFNYHFTLLNSPIVNAFALPGGYVYVSRGLLALASNEAELAGVIAHELGHVNARHTAERLGAQRMAQFGVIASAIGASLLGLPANSVAQIGQTIATLAIQSYSREQELESDTLGVRYMSRAGYDPDAMATFLGSLGEQSQIEARSKGLPPGTVDQYNLMATHPRTADRVRQAQASAQTSRPPNARTARKDYLAMIDGMLFGDDPAQGIVKGQRFIHPDMRFTFEAPAGFRVQNSPEQVIASDANGAALKFDIASMNAPGQRTENMSNYIARQWANKTRVSDIQAINVNGMIGATARATGNTQQGAVDVRFVALARDQNTAFRMLFISPQARTAALSDAFRRSTYSMRRLSTDEARKVRALTLRVRPARSGERIEKLSKHLPYGSLNDDWFRVLNDMPAGAQPAVNQLLKVVDA
jgi:predicted Zn-dependent protease